jgi:hypothetical protein
MTREMTGPMLVRLHPLYRRWCFMRSVCRNPRHADYDAYGARGIDIGSEFEEFWDFVDLIETKLGYPPGFDYRWKLSRIDQHGNYTIKNLKWDVAKHVGRRCDKAFKLKYKNKTRPLRDWCDEYNINIHTAIGRIERGWSPKQVLGLEPGIKEQRAKKRQ